MFDRKLIAAGLITGMAVSGAIACGEDFSWRGSGGLVSQRTAALKATPANSFTFEAARLVPTPDDGLKPVEPDSVEPADLLMRVEAEGLTPQQAERLAAMRAAPDDAAAFAAGEGLPPAVRLYTAGAAAYHAKDRAKAAERFKAVLALPEADARLRAVWAAYMLGRIAETDEDEELAFEQTRALARGGAPDPLGLAVASLGEQARTHLTRAQELLGEDGTLPPAQAEPFARAIDRAVALYAEQAARDSQIGLNSLRAVARQLTADPAQIAAAFRHPLPQRLVVAYALAGGVSADQTMLANVAEALEQHGIEAVVGADRLASLAYWRGRFDLAAQLAEKAPGPLAAWVKAKLALQRGDMAAAAVLLAEASRAFPAQDAAALDPGNVTRVRGEAGTLALARGEYVNALTQLYPLALTYWSDVAHIAERVLTTDELKSFIDSRPAPPLPAPETEAVPETVPEAAFRAILARRLMRDERFAEAPAYFANAEIAGQAAAYTQALRDAREGWWPIARAEAWFRAATLAREHGMEFMGTEEGPDFASVEGAYGDDSGWSKPKPDGAYVTEGERTRFDASRPKPDERFHYRYVAVAHAEAAADLLPRRSEAFAAVLCHATRWMYSTHREDRVKALYARYVKEGPVVEWAGHFGRGCPEPDFEGAERQRLHYLSVAAREWMERHPLRLAGGALTVGLLAGWFARRRWRAPRPA